MRPAMHAIAQVVLVATALVMPTPAGLRAEGRSHGATTVESEVDIRTAAYLAFGAGLGTGSGNDDRPTSPPDAGASWPTIVAACLGVIVGGVLARRRIRRNED